MFEWINRSVSALQCVTRSWLLHLCRVERMRASQSTPSRPDSNEPRGQRSGIQRFNSEKPRSWISSRAGLRGGQGRSVHLVSAPDEAGWAEPEEAETLMTRSKTRFPGHGQTASGRTGRCRSSRFRHISGHWAGGCVKTSNGSSAFHIRKKNPKKPHSSAGIWCFNGFFLTRQSDPEDLESGLHLCSLQSHA